MKALLLLMVLSLVGCGDGRSPAAHENQEDQPTYERYNFSPGNQ